MAHYNFHRVLIAAAILFDFVFTIWAVGQYRSTGDGKQLALAFVSSIVTLALVAYLVYFNRNLAVLRHVLAGRGATMDTVSARAAPMCTPDTHA